MRLIDADRLLEIIEGFGEWDGEVNTFRLGIFAAKELIQDAPTMTTEDDENPSELSHAIEVLEEMLDDYGPYLEDYPEIVQAVRLAQKVLREVGINED